MTMNNDEGALLREFAALAARIGAVEAEQRSAAEVLGIMARDWLPRLQAALSRLEREVSEIRDPAPKPQRYRRRDWETCQKARALSAAGQPVRQISLALDIPYTTAYGYVHASEAELERLRESGPGA